MKARVRLRIINAKGVFAVVLRRVGRYLARPVKVKPDVAGHDRRWKRYGHKCLGGAVVPRCCVHKPAGVCIWRH